MGYSGREYFEKNFEPEKLIRDLVNQFTQVEKDRGIIK